MADSTNPYASPAAENVSCLSFQVGVLALVLPLIAVFPLYHFVHNYASEVMRPIAGPDHRMGFLDVHFTGIMFSVVVYCWLAGFALLWHSQTLPKFTKAATILFAALAFPAIYVSILIYYFYCPMP